MSGSSSCSVWIMDALLDLIPSALLYTILMLVLGFLCVDYVFRIISAILCPKK